MKIAFGGAKAERAFTLMELVVVLLVVVVLLALIVPGLRKRQQALLQSHANVRPDQVFLLRCEPKRAVFEEGEDLVFLCEVVNPTSYRLDCQWPRMFFAQDLDAAKIKVFRAVVDDPPIDSKVTLRPNQGGPIMGSFGTTEIGAGSSLKFEVVLTDDAHWGNVADRFAFAQSLSMTNAVSASPWLVVTQNGRQFIARRPSVGPGGGVKPDLSVEIAIEDGAVPVSGELFFFFDRLKSNAMEFRIEPPAEASQ